MVTVVTLLDDGQYVFVPIEIELEVRLLGGDPSRHPEYRLEVEQSSEVTARMAAVNGFTKDSKEAIELFEYLRDHHYGTITTGQQGSVIFTLKVN
jgi:hypothetical protein